MTQLNDDDLLEFSGVFDATATSAIAIPLKKTLSRRLAGLRAVMRDDGYDSAADD